MTTDKQTNDRIDRWTKQKSNLVCVRYKKNREGKNSEREQEMKYNVSVALPLVSTV